MKVVQYNNFTMKHKTIYEMLYVNYKLLHICPNLIKNNIAICMYYVYIFVCLYKQ